MVILNRILFVLILSFFGYIVIHLPSGFAAPSQYNNDCIQDKLNDYCKNNEGEEPNICSEYCKNAHTIDFSYLPSPLDKLNETLVGKLRVGCDGACADGTTCVCTIASGELEETLTKIGFEPYDVADIAYNSTIVIGGKNISLGGLLCENPK